MPAIKQAPKEYVELHARHRALCEKSQESDGKDKAVRKEKATVMQEIRQIERESARRGVHLDGGAVLSEHDSKRSLQEEYCRRFDNTNPVKLNRGGREVEDTMQGHHRARLLNR